MDKAEALQVGLGRLAELRRLLSTWASPWPGAARTGSCRQPHWLQRQNFNKLVGWDEAVTAIGAPGLHFHDLRHTGNTLAAASRASTRDLMVRMGHDSIRAALIYQHATNEAGQAIAAALDAQVKAARGEVDEDPGDAGAGSSASRGQWPANGPCTW